MELGDKSLSIYEMCIYRKYEIFIYVTVYIIIIKIFFSMKLTARIKIKRAIYFALLDFVMID